MHFQTNAILFACVAPIFVVSTAHAQDAQIPLPEPPPGYERQSEGYAYNTVPTPPSGSPSIVVASPEPPYVTGPRSGWAFQLGLGMIGYANANDTRTHASQGASMNLALGGYLTPRSAMFLRLGFFGQSSENVSNPVTAYAIQLEAQRWLDERWVLGGGLGIGGVVFEHIPASGAGLALNARIGYAFSHWTHHSLLFLYEANLVITPAVLANGHFLIFEWQVH